MNSACACLKTRVVRRRGFSLIELVVATGITVVLAVMLLSASSAVLASWNRSRGRLTTSNQSKLSLDQIADDLEGVLSRRDGKSWFAATVTGTQPSSGGDAGIADALYSTSTGSRCKPASDSYDVEPPSGAIEDMKFGHVGVWLRFFITERAANDSRERLSSVRAVSYQIAHVPEGTVVGSGRRYFLFRSSVRPGPFDEDNNPINESNVKHSTFTTGYDIVGDNAYNNASEIALQVDNDLLEPGRVRRPIKSGIIASDVIDFGVRIFCRDPAGNFVERFPVDRLQSTPPKVWAFLATSSAVATPTNPSTAPSGLGTAVVRDFPVVVEVMIRVLSDEGVEKISSLEENRIKPPGGSSNYDSYWWEIARAHSTVYTRRIEIKSTALLAP